MNDRDFCLWLQGFVELSGTCPTEGQWKSIKEHLALVFNKVTPPVTEKQKESIFDQIKKDSGTNHPFVPPWVPKWVPNQVPQYFNPNEFTKTTITC